MSVYISLPVDRTPSKFADWLEITALLDGDHNASLAELRDLLSGETDGEEDQIGGDLSPDGVTSQVVLVADEIRRRSAASLKNYPFKFDGSKIVGPKNISAHSLPYVFCLLISYFGPKNTDYHSKWKTDLVSKKFEHLSKASLEMFLENKKNKPHVTIFGFPRDWKGDAGARKFRAALAALCAASGQMKCVPRKNSKNAKDGGLDIIAWGNFPDRLPGSLLFAAQCGVGGDWTAKLKEVDDFFDWYVTDYPKYAKGIFIPHVPDLYDECKEEDWLQNTKSAGIIFNRCRIAFLVDSWWDKETSDLCVKALEQIRVQARLS